MLTVNTMGNAIGKEQLSKLQEMMQAHPTLVSLCGIADDATEADLSGLRMDADDAAVLADELPAKGAMTTLNIASNYLYDAGADALASALKAPNSALTSVHARDNELTDKGKKTLQQAAGSR